MKRSPLHLLIILLAIATHGQAQGTLLSLNHDDSGLGLAATGLATETYTMVGANGTTGDGYPSGVAELDCFGERFFYVLANPYRLVTLDAESGELLNSVSIDNPLNADVPATNIAYDWTDDKLYAMCQWYSGGNPIQLISINPETGEVEPVSDGPDIGSYYGSGNCDMDALGNRYFMMGGGKLKVWDTNSGEMLANSTLPTLFGSYNLESWTHPMYHAVEDRIYALHMLQPEDIVPNGPLYQSEVRLVRMHPETAEVEWYTEEAISMDGIQSGLCDMDPFNNRIFYHRANSLLIFSSETGAALGSIPNPSGSISPWANLQYHDLSTDVAALVGSDASSTSIEWDGESFLTLEHGLGASTDFQQWMGVNGELIGSEFMEVTDFGTVHAQGSLTGKNGRSVDVVRMYEIVREQGTIAAVAPLQPTNCLDAILPISIYAASGQIVATFTPSSSNNLSSPWSSMALPLGLYFVRAEGCRAQKVFIQ
jgi:hypothetical protein